MNLIREGAVTVDAEGVFYNPRMKLNRDICVSMGRALEISEYLDGLSASGLRGLRMAMEAGVDRVTLNDVGLKAYRRIMENVERNGLSNCEVCRSNANVLMHERRFEVVDLDPFGTPSPFLSAAARSAVSCLFITATDTAPLCGAHIKSGIRKYMAVPVKTYYHREMGARILLGLAARELARLDKGMEPLLTHATAHYLRTYLKVYKGAKFADRTLEHVGYLEHCHGCGRWKVFHSLGDALAKKGGCNYCNGSWALAGPLWLGPIQKATTIEAAMGELDDNKEAESLLRSCRDEIEVPMYYDHHRICKKIGVTPGKIDDLVSDLQEAGWRASRTHFTGVGVKTDAGMDDIVVVIKARGKG